MVIRNKEYYNQLDAEVKNDLRTLNYHIRQAERYKHIHELTKGRSGLYALIHKWAERNNHFHCNAGLKLGKSNLVALRNDVPTRLHPTERGGALTRALSFLRQIHALFYGRQ